MDGNIVRSIGIRTALRVATVLPIAIATPVVAQRVATLPDASVRASARVTVQVERTPLREVLEVIARQSHLSVMYSRALLPVDAQVTMHVTNVPVLEAFAVALRGTGVVASILPTGYVALARAATTANGTITGHVTEAATQRPIGSASVMLDNEPRGVVTDISGAFRFGSVAPGTHRVTVRLIGYAREIRTVTVPDEGTVAVEIALRSSANVLDQVVVTGTIAATELKAVSNAITVITTKEIEQRGITKIEQLFRGDVPGLFAQNKGSASSALLDEVTMFSRGATALSGVSTGLSSDAFTSVNFLTNPIKTYVDGIELADPKYLNQIDPKSIERIEIIAGPQASTIYGSNAINGVMQIFTKRGTSPRPELTLNLQSGWVENDFSTARTPQHDYSAQVNGIEGRLSYNAGSAWNYIGPWTPAKQTARLDGFGGLRFELPTRAGRMTTDFTFRRGTTLNRQHGATFQRLTGYQETGLFSMSATAAGVWPATTSTLAGQTLGVEFGYAPTSWWSQNFGIGQDIADAETRQLTRSFINTIDTTLFLRQTHTDRRSLHYSTTVRIPVTSFAQTMLTGGGDAWQSLTSSVQANPQTLTGTLSNVVGVSRQPSHNAGAFLQAQIGIADRLFITPGFRIEWNPGVGDKFRVLPGKYGVAYTQDFGVVTAKLRGSYGRSTRPPAFGLKTAIPVAEAYPNSYTTNIEPYYPNFDLRLANPELGPEHQQGGEGGVEVYFGSRASLVVTRYNQTVDRLIDLVSNVDSVDIFPQWQAIYGTWKYPMYQSEYLNVGSIRNQGWELQGSVTTGPLTTRGTYSWTKSRVIGVTPQYRTLLANQPRYQPGATFQYLPEHTWAWGMTYARGITSVVLSVTGTAQIRNDNNELFFRHLNQYYIRLPLDQWDVRLPSQYASFNSGYAVADLTASRRLWGRVDGELQVQNLTDHYTNDFNAAFATIGRQVKLGLRGRW